MAATFAANVTFSSSAAFDLPALATDINACQASPCKQSPAAPATCADKPAPAVDGVSGRTCTCGAGYSYNENSGCQGVLLCMSDKPGFAYHTARHALRLCKLCHDGNCRQPPPTWSLHVLLISEPRLPRTVLLCLHACTIIGKGQ